MGERIVGRNFLISNGYNSGTRLTDDVLVSWLKGIYERGEPVTEKYMLANYDSLRQALRNHGRRRLFDLAGIYFPKRGEKMYGPFRTRQEIGNGL